MKVTKFQHACLLLEKDSTTLLIDPGVFSHDLITPKKLDAIVITHEHTDHFDEARVKVLLEDHPQAVLYAHESITGHFATALTTPVRPGETYSAGDFSLRFFGGTHAAITDGVAVPPNYGVFIDERLYYPGDSFVLPDQLPVEVLALPVSAPWLKLDDSLALLKIARPKVAFPTHDGILSEDGKTIVDTLAGTAANAIGAQYRRLDSSFIEL